IPQRGDAIRANADEVPEHAIIIRRPANRKVSDRDAATTVSRDDIALAWPRTPNHVTRGPADYQTFAGSTLQPVEPIGTGADVIALHPVAVGPEGHEKSRQEVS